MKRTHLLIIGIAVLSIAMLIYACGNSQETKLRSAGDVASLVHIGMSSLPVNGTWKALYPFNDDIEANALYISQAEKKCLIISLDIASFSYRTDLEFRKVISEKTEIPLENIIIAVTHNHTGPVGDDYRKVDRTPLANKMVKVAQQAIVNSSPAEMTFAVANVGHRFSINRRNYIDNDLGELTFWYGYNYLEDGSVDARWLLNERLKRWYGDNIPEKYRTDEPLINKGDVDELLQLLVFRDYENKKVIGSLIRFSAHTQLAMCASKWKYSSCVPGFARKRLKEKLGGDALFINGPCGDLVIKEFSKFMIDPDKFNWAETPLGPSGQLSVTDDEKLWELVPKEGKAMADAALDVYDPGSFRPLKSFDIAFSKQNMPMREDLPHTFAGYEKEKELIKKKAMVAYKKAIETGADVATIKKLAEKYNRAHWLPQFIGWADITEEDLNNRSIPYELQAFSLNDIVLVGLPGETVMATNDYLRSNSCGKRLITMTECNSDMGYIATRKQFPFGSYEVHGGLNAIDGEQKLREAALALINKVEK